MDTAIPKRIGMKEKLAALGPGFLIVGSFIGPGTVTSSTRAGAQYGFTLFWCILFSVLAVIVMQGMAARLGIITQSGLAENLRNAFASRPLLSHLLCGLVAIAISLGGFAYMGGDLTGTALGVSSLTGLPTNLVAPLFGLVILVLLNLVGDAIKYLERLLGLCVLVMACVFLFTMVVVRPDLKQLLQGCIPTVPSGSILTCLSLIGTTVVPYNLFLHAASAKRTWHSPQQLPLCAFGTTLPMLIGGLVTGSIFITSATVMRGMSVEHAMDLSLQLQPTLGPLAQPFLAVGLIAAGVSSAICTPMGVSYVLAGLFGWETHRKDKRYVFTNAAVLVTGIVIAALGTNPLALIMAAQAVNGLVLPVVVGITLYLTSRSSIMGAYRNSFLTNSLGLMIFVISLILGLTSLFHVFGT